MVPSAKKGSKVHLAVDTLGHLLTLHVTPADADDRAQGERPAQAVQAATGDSVDLPTSTRATPVRSRPRLPARTASNWRSSNSPRPSAALILSLSKDVLLPRRWVVERSFAWATRFRRLVKDYERYPSTLADLHIVAFVCLMLKQAAQLAASS